MFSSSASSLYGQTTFYDKFYKDLSHAKRRVIIESLFITVRRMATLLPILERLRKSNVRIIINTKSFDEHEAHYREQSIWVVGVMQDLGIEVLFTNGHHRKIAIVDDNTLYEGSLNILSQNDSCELMRRIQDEAVVREMLKSTGLRRCASDMIEPMEYMWIIAIVAGCIVASIRLNVGSKFHEILVVIRSLQFFNRSKFEAYYSIVNGELIRERNPSFTPIHMIYLQKHGLINSYEEYAALCKEAKPKIYDIFHTYLVNTIKDVVLRVLPVILLPAIFFWQYWYFYVAGVALYFAYMLTTDKLGWFVHSDEVINRSQDVLLLAAFKEYLKTKH